MTNKKKKIKTLTILFFIMGLVLYLSGLLLLFIASIYFNLNFLKIIGASLFLIGFIMFMVAIIILYKDNEIKENNLNLIMKFLAGATIVLSIPTMISSFLGMNVPLGSLATFDNAFTIILLISVVISLVIAYLLKKKNML